MNARRRLFRIGFPMAFALLAPVANASEGVFEINADCARFGCFDGDNLFADGSET